MRDPGETFGSGPTVATCMNAWRRHQQHYGDTSVREACITGTPTMCGLSNYLLSDCLSGQMFYHARRGTGMSACRTA